MVAVAANAEVLSRRVRYFVKKERAEDARLAQLLDEIETPAYLFGGVVRDLALYGKSKLADKDADIDIVCAARGCVAGSFFSRLEHEHGVARNRFGGFRLTTQYWKVDLWAAEDTWAFREGKFGYNSIESLLETTITNWEAVLFRLDGGSLVYRDDYFADIQKGYLDIVFSENPNLLGMYVRLMRACTDRRVQYLSEKTRGVVRDAIEKHSLEELMSYEQQHYRFRYIHESEYERVKGAVLSGGTGAVRIAGAEGAPELFP